MNHYAMSEDEFNALSKTMHLVALFEAVLGTSSARPDVSGEQLGAFAATLADSLRSVVRSLEERFAAARGLATVEGLGPFDVTEIIDLLAGHRYAKVSRWREIEAHLERCAVIEQGMVLALKAWRSAIDSEALAAHEATGSDPTVRFRHLRPDLQAEGLSR